MLLGCEFIFENAQAVDFYLDSVAWRNGSYTCGGASGNQVAGLKRHGSSDVSEQFGDGKDQVAGGGLLFDYSVEPCDDGDGRAACGVDFVRDDGADGAEGVEALATRPLAVRLLNVAGGDVVDADVAANVRANILVGAYLVAAAGGEDAEVPFLGGARGGGGGANRPPGG